MYFLLFFKMEKMEAELQQFESERGDRIRHLHDKHKREMEAFDKESLEKGIRYVIYMFSDTQTMLIVTHHFSPVLWRWPSRRANRIRTKRAACPVRC